ncbi:hypothetical protein [Bradyrhizobium sp. USDA 3458]|uniref:hypothetical protein n=1 Tax=Bradyrhizobium sp. USDA 3458 TaxID=2591461 RepID=UPI001144BD92|nr:hypothetical protein [Bradyrhizobium sp. USDA 3458]
MSKKAFDKIMAGLRDVVEGRWASATLFHNGKPIQRYTPCRGCGGLSLTVRGRCDSCGARKLSAEPVEK